MTINELKIVYANFSSFVEAFTSVDKTVEKGVLDNNEDLTLFNVSFNDNEFMSFAELGKLLSFLEDYLKLNGVDTTEIKCGRPMIYTDDRRSAIKMPIDWDRTTLTEH